MMLTSGFRILEVTHQAARRGMRASHRAERLTVLDREFPRHVIFEIGLPLAHPFDVRLRYPPTLSVSALPSGGVDPGMRGAPATGRGPFSPANRREGIASDLPTRDDVQQGMTVRVDQDEENDPGEPVVGDVRSIVTDEHSHPKGIKAELQSGITGRVKDIHPEEL